MSRQTLEDLYANYEPGQKKLPEDFECTTCGSESGEFCYTLNSQQPTSAHEARLNLWRGSR